jgi:putative phosphoesterase
MLDVVVLSDTHLRSGTPARGALPAALLPALQAADLILHAGDLLDAGVLDLLWEYAPVSAVLGNNDTALDLPITRVVDLDGVPTGMIHDSGPAAGRAARLHRRFPGCRLVVFGHSHIPWNQPGVEGQILFNPGSPTQRRAQPRPTFGRIRVDAGAVVGREIVELQPG